MQPDCPYCSTPMHISKLTCGECALAVEGSMPTPALFRLSQEEQRFAELFLLASGSLKEMARQLEFSYPTIRNRLDQLIEHLETEKQKDKQRQEQILNDIEAGRISAKHGMRLIEGL